jgi:hypothetical protein
MSRFTQKNAAEDASQGLYDRWAVRDALPIQAKATRARRIKAKMLPAVIRQTGVDGPACKLAGSISNDLTSRSTRLLVSGDQATLSRITCR